MLWHTLRSRGSGLLLDQQTGGLRQRRRVTWVIRADNHPDEWSTSSREITLPQKQTERMWHVTKDTYSNYNIIQWCITWYLAWVSMSLREGLGSKAGWEWYQPTTLWPLTPSSSDAWVWETGSISHCRPVLRLLHGSAAQICTNISKMTNKSTGIYCYSVPKLTEKNRLSWMNPLINWPLTPSLPLHMFLLKGQSPLPLIHEHAGKGFDY